MIGCPIGWWWWVVFAKTNDHGWSKKVTDRVSLRQQYQSDSKTLSYSLQITLLTHLYFIQLLQTQSHKEHDQHANNSVPTQISYCMQHSMLSSPPPDIQKTQLAIRGSLLTHNLSWPNIGYPGITLANHNKKRCNLSWPIIGHHGIILANQNKEQCTVNDYNSTNTIQNREV